MSGSRKGRDDDAALFRAAMGDVTPLKTRAAPPAKPPAPRPPPPPIAAPPRAAAPVKKPPPPAPPNPGIDRRSAERLKRGEMAIDRTLDLHGMTQDAAHRTLTRAILAAWEAGARVVLVVTGKGQGGEGVLRAAAPRWLAEPALAPKVLRIAPAQPRHGGSGALYVLLRRRRDAP